MCNGLRGSLTTFMAFISICACGFAIAEDNLTLHGILVSEPCGISSESQNIIHDFGGVNVKQIYANDRTEGDVIELHLINCDSDFVDRAKVSFKGGESSELKGFLSLSPESGAKGIVVGLETLDGKIIQVNNDEPAREVANDNLMIKFKVFIKGEPNALSSKSIVPGDFTSSLNLEFLYF